MDGSPTSAAQLWHFDDARADRAQRFVERGLVHTKGRHARRPFLLEPWQRDEIIRPMFGTVMYDPQLEQWVRQYRLAWIELGRKNGKSELLSALALYFLCADGEESAEVYGAACDRDQAALVYNVAKRMVELSPVLSKRLEVLDSKKRIIDPKTNSVYQVLAADAGGNLGQNPHAIVFDEVLTQPNRELWDALRTGMGARSQPIMIAATTAGNTGNDFCLEEHEYSLSVAESPDTDPHRLVFARNCPTDWNWEDEGSPADPETGRQATGWYLANPALGSFLSIQTLRAEAAEAKQRPSAQNAFRQFRLNQWVSQTMRWLDMAVWDVNAGSVPASDLPTLMESMPAYAGLDLASAEDFAAWCLVFPGGEDTPTAVIWRFWVPETAVERHRSRDRIRLWAEQGHVTIVPGNTIRFDDIETAIHADMERYRVEKVGYDPWQSPQIVQRLEDAGVLCVKIPQTLMRLSAPTKEIERLLAERDLAHGGNPVARWMADNVEAIADGEGHIKPSKKKSADKIDGISALVNALFVALLVPEPDLTPEVFDLEAFL
ncbi:terminase large subunit [Parafrankia sp. EUN1f]|uniref:terminase large subunit n=1 Tax=Parafrankia sp. EUN1f TaxID=102897 RepID=UPI0001C45571|nr:terminase TerL endonuclease subunit [Parafrankia sp. EUN1f]EFC86456.1 Terminase [Parafrankia sp. EUN1f]